MIYGLTNSKGGVGKTTIAVHLAAFLVGKKRSVLFIDADPQQSATSWIKEGVSRAKLLQIDAANEVIVEVDRHKPEFDDIVIDGPAGLSAVTRAIMLRADKAFFPCGPSILDLRAARLAVDLLKEAQQTRGGKPDGFVIPNKLQKRVKLSEEMLSAVHRLGVPVLEGISLRQSFADAAGQATLVGEMGWAAKPAAKEMNKLLKEMTK